MTRKTDNPIRSIVILALGAIAILLLPFFVNASPEETAHKPSVRFDNAASDEDAKIDILLDQIDKENKTASDRAMRQYNYYRLADLKTQVKARRAIAKQHTKSAVIGTVMATGAAGLAAAAIWWKSNLWEYYGYGAVAFAALTLGLGIYNLATNWKEMSVGDKAKGITQSLFAIAGGILSFLYPIEAGMFFLLMLGIVGSFNAVISAVKSSQEHSEADKTQTKVDRIEKDLKDNPAI